MTSELNPLDISGMPELAQLADEVQRTGQRRVLRRGPQAIAVLAPVPQESTTDIWVGYDPDRVRQALHAGIGMLAGVDTAQLKADLRAQRAQDSTGRPA
jgi:hypothetical protein